MWRARARGAYTVRPALGERACSSSSGSRNRSRLCAGAVLVTSASTSALSEQRRFSFKYARNVQLNEMRQPSYINDKRFGLFSDERNVGKVTRGLPHITPLYNKHMNLWETDTDASTNRFFRSYVFGQRELHQLLGRPHGFEADEQAGRQGPSPYEMSTDMRYKGVPRPAITNLHYEPEWNYTLYRSGSQGSQLANPRSPLTEEVLGPELLEIRDVKTVEHCKAWFDRLQYLIKLHYDAVGDIGPFRSRHTQHVHEFFVEFHDALSSFDFQDSYLYEQFHKVRPAELEDLFGVFLEMEGNYVNEDFCPRCSLPYSTTRYCGEGDRTTPFRKHRGRWAPHQRWGREWYDVVMRRAEALWNRATEDPYFGTEEHTQRQVEAMVNVYAKTHHRGKLLDFINAIRGSKEFLLGRVVITDAMQATIDHVLDTTPHPHLLTNGFMTTSAAAVYIGDSSAVPQDPLQLRIDLELGKYRRRQKEEGVVRVPPASWRLDTSAIVPYKMDSARRVTNWREVKEGIEKSFLSTGLPREAYTSLEWREMLRLKERIARRAEDRAALEAEKVKEAASKKPGTFVVFPDKSWYRVFDTTTEALRPFGVTRSGAMITVQMMTYPNAAAVPYDDPKSGAAMVFDTTAARCDLFGDFESGDVLRLTERSVADDGSGDAAPSGASYDVVVIGVNTKGAESEWTLCAQHLSPVLHAEKGIVELGKDCLDILQRYAAVTRTATRADVPLLEAHRTTKEECLGQVVGVRNGVLYAQWRLLPGGGGHSMDRSVAMPLGTPETVRRWCTVTGESSAAADGKPAEALAEPPSWHTPFRNDFADERLKELEQAPFGREKLAPLIQGKYTPKEKRFGYTQHTTQDDFATKEYKDRVLAKQFFHNPQAFEVLPDQRQRSVLFRGKWEAQRVHGLPTVDRNELENGWGEAEVISDAEVAVIEQALRDISGRRPGNYVKSPSETQSLELNESWWTPLHYGWQENNRNERAFHDSSEQKLIDSTRLPFGGKLAPFGTTYGIAERVREIAADYSKGFGLGPNGHSPTHDTAAFNTLGAEEQRRRTLGLGNALVRLFQTRLGTQDIHAWALEMCGENDVNVRRLLLSVHEWREKGRPPSLLLRKVLARYLAEDITRFNDGLPANVPKLNLGLDDSSSSSSGSGGSNRNSASGTISTCADSTQTGNVWADVDRNEYAHEFVKQYPAMQQRGVAAEQGYIVALLLRTNVDEGAGSVAQADAHYMAFLQQDVVNRFQLELARIAGKGLPPSFVAQKSNQSHRGSERSAANVVPYVALTELAALLRKMGLTSESISLVVRGLSSCPEHEPLPGGGVAVPTALLLSWGGPGSATSSTGRGGGNAGRNGLGGARAATRGGGAAGAGSGSNNAALMQAIHGGKPGSSAGGSGEQKLLVQVLEELALRDDGLAMDVQYTIRENKRNAVLRQEFFNVFLLIFRNDHVKVAKLYNEYCEGKYVPNVTEAIEAFVAFLATMSKTPEKLAAAVPYFEATGTVYTQLQLLPPSVGPFQFENTLVESIETAELFRKYGILAGPTRVPATAFIAANSKSINYLTQREGDIVYVQPGPGNDQGLASALRKSAHYEAIAGNPALRHVLNSPNDVALIGAFNRLFYRVTPMLHFFRSILQEYSSLVQGLRMEAENANRGLARALENELSPTIENDFRRNSERYWRNVLEGRNVEESMMSNSGYGSGGRSPQYGGGGAGDGRRGGSAMSSTLGGAEHSPQQHQQQRGVRGSAGSTAAASSGTASTGGGGGAASVAGASAPPSSGGRKEAGADRSRQGASSRAGGPASSTSGTVLKNLLSTLPTQGRGRGGRAGAGGRGAAGSRRPPSSSTSGKPPTPSK